MATSSSSSSLVEIVSIMGIFALCLVECEESTKIKIVDSPALSRFSSSSSSQQKLTLRTQPSNLTGPPHLHELSGSCFEGSERGYKYRVCPFQNVTQKEERQSWMSYHGVLGVWRDWIVVNDTFVGLNYVLGEQCGAVDREAKVMFNCSTNTRVHNITETSTCSYNIWLDTPMACFKGAMQVYQVLKERQLEEWDRAEQEYYRNEITFQGLTKRRKSVLIEAGLCNPLKTYSNKESDSPEEGLAIAGADPPGYDDHQSTELLQCQQEKESLQKQLKEINHKIIDVIRAHPHFAALLNFNHSRNITTVAAQNVNSTKPNVNVDTKTLVRQHPGTSIAEHNVGHADGDQIEQKLQEDDRELIALLNEDDLLSDQV